MIATPDPPTYSTAVRKLDPTYAILQDMRSMLLVLFLSLSVVPTAQQRAWKEGWWTASARPELVAIETATDVVSARPTAADDVSAWGFKPGDPVRYVVEGSALHLLDARDHEHTLTVTESAPKYSSEYAALGGGHYIRSVTPGGSAVTLEDGTRWDIDPRQQFAVAGWNPDDLISIRRSTDDPAFAFEVDNTSQDDGALANRRVR